MPENTLEFDVFQQDQLTVPARAVAVLDLNGSLKPHLVRMGIEHTEFDASTPMGVPVFVTSVKPKEGPQTERFRELERWIESGGTAVYISGPGVHFDGRHRAAQVRSAAVPFSANVEHAQGLWSSVPHLVKEHPVFDGLPADGAMREVYENVRAGETLRNLGGEAIVASVDRRPLPLSTSASRTSFTMWSFIVLPAPLCHIGRTASPPPLPFRP